MESVIIAGLASAFVLSVLDYWFDTPIIKAITGIASSAVALLLLGVWGTTLLPMILASTFLGALGLNLTSRSGVELPRSVGRR